MPPWAGFHHLVFGITEHDDVYSVPPGSDRGAALASAAGQGGALVVLSHGPDIVPTLPRLPALVLVGHTHCGQVALPIVGAPLIPSNYGARYACGIVREGGRATIVTAGVGTSMLPFRLGAPPDMWLLTLHG